MAMRNICSGLRRDDIAVPILPAIIPEYSDCQCGASQNASPRCVTASLRRLVWWWERPSPWGAVLHRSEVRAQLPQPCLGSGDADGDWASPLQHTVEGMDGDVHLGRPTPVRARAQPVADHLLEPPDGCLGPSPPHIVGCFLPSRPSVPSDAVQVAVALRGRGLGCLARHGRGPRRHDDRRLGITLGDRGRDALLVVRRRAYVCRRRSTAAPSTAGRRRPSPSVGGAERRQGRR